MEKEPFTAPEVEIIRYDEEALTSIDIPVDSNEGMTPGESQ
jgi:hypothetical protein